MKTRVVLLHHGMINYHQWVKRFGKMLTFSIIIGIGVALGLVWVTWQAPQKQAAQLFDISLWVLLGGLLGSRAVYVAGNWPYYQAYPIEIPQVWLGGLSGIGMLVGSGLTLVLVAGTTRQRVGSLADALLPLAIAITVAAWLACWLSGYAYGVIVKDWWGIPAQDEMGTVAPRFPVQLLGALSTLGIFWAIDGLQRGPARSRTEVPGKAAGLGLLGLSLELFCLSYLRGDPIPIWRGQRLDTWGALGLIGLVLLLLIYSTLKHYIRNTRDARKNKRILT